MHEHYVEDFLRERGLTNYWGYNTARASSRRNSPTAPALVPAARSTSSRRMVRELHRAGIKVILDVVYNHTAEGNELGPTLSLRGIDNPTYYALTGGPAAQPGALLPELHRHRQHPRLSRGRRRSAWSWTRCATGSRDARGRVPLRPRLGAGPAEDGTFRASRRVLRRRLPGPGAVARDAHRRAVGPRHLPGRQLPDRLVGVERPFPRHGAPLRQGRSAGSSATSGRA